MATDDASPLPIIIAGTRRGLRGSRIGISKLRTNW
jgi:hypothetical protein